MPPALWRRARPGRAPGPWIGAWAARPSQEKRTASRPPRWGLIGWSWRIAPNRRCIGDAARCEARFAPRRCCRCIAAVDDASP
eukprot:6449576-Pyramimonas_sp.AAC.1